MGNVAGVQAVFANLQEYLVSHGNSGGFGRFVPLQPLTCDRGQRVVIRSQRGLELGVVLCEATSRHTRFLADATVGQLLRPATVQDEEEQERLRASAQRLFEDSRRLASELGLALEVLDVEVLLDGQRAVMQYLAGADCAYDSFVTALSDRHNLAVRMENLALPAEPAEEEEHGGCGKPGCGRAKGGGCTSCGTGGGCSSCGSGKVDMKAYFAHLRTQMEQRAQRTPLL